MVRAIEKLCRRYLKRRGWTVAPARDGDYFLYRYTDGLGSFDYDRYRQIQTAGNKRKIANVWADRPTIEFICAYLRDNNASVFNGLCHGSRNGTEVKWFREITGAEINGTDISDTAEKFPYLTQWDFHEENPDWKGKFDFVYTNSHDHAYDPKKALDAWVGQLKPSGTLFIEHTMAHSHSGGTELDPFNAHPTVLPYLILKWGSGRYAVTEILEPVHTKENGLKIWIFAVKLLGKLPALECQVHPT